MSLPVACEWEDAARNGGKILVGPDNFKFAPSYKSKKKWFMHCRNKKNGCNVTLTVDKEKDMIISVRGEHNHDSDLVRTQVLKHVKESLENAERNPTVPPRQILQNITEKVLADPTTRETGVGSIPLMKTISRTIQKKRKTLLDCPDIPRSWEDVEVPEALKTDSSGEPWVILDDHTDEDDNSSPKILGFASKTGLDLLKKAVLWSIDGTFEIMKPTMFSQLWIFYVLTETNASVPAAFFLLPDKKKSTYKIVLEKLNNLDVKPPKKIFIDFERAEISALTEVYKDEDVTLSGCDTHLKRNLRKHLTAPNNDLLTDYNNDADFQTWVRYIWALSLVPEEDIVRIFEEHIVPKIPYRGQDDDEDLNNSNASDNEEDNVFNENLDKYKVYIESNYVGRMNPRTGRRNPPSFKHSLFSKYTNILEDQDTTTNRSEGFNLQLKLSIPRNANLWALINQFRREDALVANKLREAALGIFPEAGKTKNKDRKNRRKRLFELVSNYERMSTNDYMRYVVDFYSTDWQYYEM